MRMKLLLLICLFYISLDVTLSDSQCRIITSKLTNNVTFRCTELSTLQNYLDTATSNTTIITISDSNLPNIPSHSFARFGGTLVVLDIHGSGIETCESQAFIGLTKLEKLILWGNNLTYVPVDWFMDMYSLKTLDLSFNFIQEIDYRIYQKLPYLENFYFDYNQLRYIDFNLFADLRSLKRVKFSKNPWSWPFRARLTWQMESQRVDAPDIWEDWKWMSIVIKDCIDSGRGELPSDKVLDCAVDKLLTFTYETFSIQERYNTVGCGEQARKLIRCMRPTNVTGTDRSDYETIRRILEDYSAVLPSMMRALSPFTL